AQGYGIYQTMTGQKGAGAHVLALGNGIMGSWLASVARGAGRTLAEKRAGGGARPGNVLIQGGHAMLPAPGLDASLQGQMREVLLTPEPSAHEDERRRRRRGGRGRFVRASGDDG